jgi:diacylglycerol O-acyltransferase / wax synthase
MYRLHGQDAAWLYRETLTTPMHTLKIFLVKLGDRQGVDFDFIHDTIPRLLHEVPMLRQRPVFVPFGLHHPVMIEDPEFDLNYHLNRAALPSPGGQLELEDMLAHIATYPLDHTRPLWQFWVVEGLEDGRIALVQKIHHALADGMASVNFIMRVWHSAYHDPDAVAPPWNPEPLPSKARLLRDAVLDHVKYDIRNFPSFCKALYSGTVAIKKAADPVVSPTLKGMNGDIPLAPWNRALSARRSFAMAQLPLDELKTLKTPLGGTLNDVVLALVAGAIRHYLLDHAQSVDDALLASIPVSRDVQATDRASGNSTAVTSTLLHIGISDPVERFEAIKASTERGKAELDVVGRDTFALLAHYIPPLLQIHTAQKTFDRQLADAPGYRPPANLSVSNVPGPRTRFEVQGNIVEELYSAGPLVDGMGLNVTVWSYAGNMNFTMVGCLKELPDVHLIAEFLQPALAELRTAVESLATAQTA